MRLNDSSSGKLKKNNTLSGTWGEANICDNPICFGVSKKIAKVFIGYSNNKESFALFYNVIKSEYSIFERSEAKKSEKKRKMEGEDSDQVKKKKENQPSEDECIAIKGLDSLSEKLEEVFYEELREISDDDDEEAISQSVSQMQIEKNEVKETLEYMGFDLSTTSEQKKVRDYIKKIISRDNVIIKKRIEDIYPESDRETNNKLVDIYLKEKTIINYLGNTKYDIHWLILELVKRKIIKDDEIRNICLCISYMYFMCMLSDSFDESIASDITSTLLREIMTLLNMSHVTSDNSEDIVVSFSEETKEGEVTMKGLCRQFIELEKNHFLHTYLAINGELEEISYFTIHENNEIRPEDEKEVECSVILENKSKNKLFETPPSSVLDFYQKSTSRISGQLNISFSYIKKSIKFVKGVNAEFIPYVSITLGCRCSGLLSLHSFDNIVEFFTMWDKSLEENRSNPKKCSFSMKNELCQITKRDESYIIELLSSQLFDYITILTKSDESFFKNTNPLSIFCLVVTGVSNRQNFHLVLNPFAPIFSEIYSQKVREKSPKKLEKEISRIVYISILELITKYKYDAVIYFTPYLLYEIQPTRNTHYYLGNTNSRSAMTESIGILQREKNKLECDKKYLLNDPNFSSEMCVKVEIDATVNTKKVYATSFLDSLCNEVQSSNGIKIKGSAIDINCFYNFFSKKGTLSKICVKQNTITRDEFDVTTITKDLEKEVAQLILNYFFELASSTGNHSFSNTFQYSKISRTYYMKKDIKLYDMAVSLFTLFSMIIKFKENKLDIQIPIAECYFPFMIFPRQINSLQGNILQAKIHPEKIETLFNVTPKELSEFSSNCIIPSNLQNIHAIVSNIIENSCISLNITDDQNHQLHLFGSVFSNDKLKLKEVSQFTLYDEKDNDYVLGKKGWLSSTTTNPFHLSGETEKQFQVREIHRKLLEIINSDDDDELSKAITKRQNNQNIVSWIIKQSNNTIKVENTEINIKDDSIDVIQLKKEILNALNVMVI